MSPIKQIKDMDKQNLHAKVWRNYKIPMELLALSHH